MQAYIHTVLKKVQVVAGSRVRQQAMMYIVKYVAHALAWYNDTLWENKTIKQRRLQSAVK